MTSLTAHGLICISALAQPLVAAQELGDWMRERLDAHPLFEPISNEELDRDPAAGLLVEGTEEGQKVARNQGQTFRACFRRVAGPSEQ